ncbi:hypothetical protein OA492_03115 [Pelagibacteraceae bacterium]|nr:hypothetical protein [Pelagibacteraceae bacterium]
MRLKFLIIPFFIVLTSCSNLDFILKEDVNLTSPTYKKTTIILSGVDIPSFYSQTLKYFGEYDENLYQLKIKINEEKIKKSVETNQAISKLEYKLTFNYELLNNKLNCIVYKKEIISRFTYEPKSSGYNFGSDQSLINFYEEAAYISLQEFIGYIYNMNLDLCSNEN